MKRTVVNDPKLGELPSADARRDAVHVAVIAAEAGDLLHPGDHVLVRDGKAYATVAKDAVGIVDPFLLGAVGKGYLFWLLLLPGSVTSLRHSWTHPALPDEQPGRPAGDVEASRAWIMDYAANAGVAYSDLVEGMEEGASVYFGEDLNERTPPELLWHHVEVVTGKHFTPKHREGVYFSCSC